MVAIHQSDTVSLTYKGILIIGLFMGNNVVKLMTNMNGKVRYLKGLLLFKLKKPRLKK